MSGEHPTPHAPLAPAVQAVVQANVDLGLPPHAGLHPEIHAPGITNMAAKRFTDAELAAEYWAPVFIHFPDPSIWDRDYEGTLATMTERGSILHRMATTPHYCEASDGDTEITESRNASDG